MGKRVSHAIEDRQEGGSLLGADGPVKVRWSDGKYIDEDEWNADWKHEDADDYNYGNTLYVARLFPYDENDEEEEDAVVSRWSCGTAKRLVPSDDGNYLEIADGSNATGMTNGCGRAILEDSVIEASGSEKWLDAANGFDDMICMVERAERTIKVKGKEQKFATLQVTEIIQEPGGEPAGKDKKKNKTSKKTGGSRRAKDEEEDEAGEVDVETAAEEILRQLAADNDGTVLKGKLLSGVANLVATDDWSHYAGEKRAITKLLTDPKGTFVKGLEGVSVKGPKIIVED